MTCLTQPFVCLQAILPTAGGPGHALSDLDSALTADINANNLPAFCADLQGLIGLAGAQSGKKIDPTTADEIIGLASLAETFAGCPAG